jgi:hypothetical protein
MIQKIQAKDRYSKDYGLLKTHWLFSFSEYQDKDNTEFGALRVFNDDIIKPSMGFPEHFHDTFEIVTIVLSGALTHKDSIGNEAVIKAGQIQRISAGDGISHSEFNYGKEPIHLYQIWFYPNSDVPSSYEQKTIPILKSQLVPITSNGLEKDTINLQADARIFILNLTKGETLIYEIQKDWGVFIYIYGGSLKINGEVFNIGDQARIIEENKVSFFGKSPVKAIFIKTKL